MPLLGKIQKALKCAKCGATDHMAKDCTYMKKFAANQARAPKGSPNGGQWVSGHALNSAPHEGQTVRIHVKDRWIKGRAMNSPNGQKQTLHVETPEGTFMVQYTDVLRRIRRPLTRSEADIHAAYAPTAPRVRAGRNRQHEPDPYGARMNKIAKYNRNHKAKGPGGGQFASGKGGGTPGDGSYVDSEGKRKLNTGAQAHADAKRKGLKSGLEVLMDRAKPGVKGGVGSPSRAEAAAHRTKEKNFLNRAVSGHSEVPAGFKPPRAGKKYSYAQIEVKNLVEHAGGRDRIKRIGSNLATPNERYQARKAVLLRTHSDLAGQLHKAGYKEVGEVDISRLTDYLDGLD